MRLLRYSTPRHFMALSAPVGSVSLDSQSSSTPCESSSLATSRGRKGKRDHLLFPLEGKCRAAAKGCTRPRVEMKRKGCPDRQTAACLGGVSFEALAVQHPRATSWPSPPQGGARVRGALCSCRLQWSRGQRDNSLFPLEGKCRVSGKRVYEASCREEAQRQP